MQQQSIADNVINWFINWGDHLKNMELQIDGFWPSNPPLRINVRYNAKISSIFTYLSFSSSVPGKGWTTKCNEDISVKPWWLFNIKATVHSKSFYETFTHGITNVTTKFYILLSVTHLIVTKNSIAVIRRTSILSQVY